MNYSLPIQQLKTNSLQYILWTEKEVCMGLKEIKGTEQKGTLNVHNSDDIFWPATCVQWRRLTSYVSVFSGDVWSAMSVCSVSTKTASLPKPQAYYTKSSSLIQLGAEYKPSEYGIIMTCITTSRRQFRYAVDFPKQCTHTHTHTHTHTKSCRFTERPPQRFACWRLIACDCNSEGILRSTENWWWVWHILYNWYLMGKNARHTRS